MGGRARERPVVLLVGPTAVGKTELAVELASELGGEVVGADSRQVYRRMDIGTAKPTPAERAAAVHHLVDVVEPDEDFDGGRFCTLAAAAIEDIRSRGRLPIVVGGSGFYLRSLTDGLPELPPVDPEVRAGLAQRLEREGREALHAELARIDPDSARRLHPRDAVRVMRALEVHALAGEPIGALPRRRLVPGEILSIGIDRPPEELEGRVRARARAMWDAGLPEEVGGLLDAGFSPRLKSMNALGYPETVLHLAGGLGTDETLERIAVRTRQLIRKQRAWFRPAQGERTLHPDVDRDEIRRHVARAAAG